MGHIKKFNQRVSDLLMWVGGIALVCMMAIACANVVLRFAGTPVSGAYELVGYLGAIVIALPLGYTQLMKSHVAVDIVSGKFPAWLRKIVLTLGFALGSIFFVVAAWQTWEHAATLQKVGELSETLRIPFYHFTFIVAAACGWMTWCLIIDLILLFIPAHEDNP